MGTWLFVLNPTSQIGTNLATVKLTKLVVFFANFIALTVYIQIIIHIGSKHFDKIIETG